MKAEETCHNRGHKTRELRKAIYGLRSVRQQRVILMNLAETLHTKFAVG